jgi:hypothetical protein
MFRPLPRLVSLNLSNSKCKMQNAKCTHTKAQRDKVGRSAARRKLLAKLAFESCNLHFALPGSKE